MQNNEGIIVRPMDSRVVHSDVHRVPSADAVHSVDAFADFGATPGRASLQPAG